MKAWTASLAFGLKAGAMVSLAVSLFIGVWEWWENPGGIFHGPDGTNWSFVIETVWSWLWPTFVLLAVTGFMGYRMYLWLAAPVREESE